MSEPILEDMNYSLVFLVPKQPFFTWLEEVLQSSGRRMKGFYFEEENVACLIPRIQSFRSQEELTIFLNQLKTSLLTRTLGEIGTDAKHCPELSANTFDSFFDLKIRDKVWLATQKQ